MKQGYFFAAVVAIVGLSAGLSNLAFSDDYNYPREPPTAPPPLEKTFNLPVSLEVIGAKRGYLKAFPLNYDPMPYRAYIQAKPNERYSLHVQNNTNQRVGVVIAVDGRNIISGAPSYLQNNERMYVLEPYGSANYEGWRTGSNQTNRFYFTKVKDSYAAAWGDTSAMGVIAMAAYPEKPRPQVYEYNPSAAAPAADAAAAPTASVKMKGAFPAPAADAAAAPAAETAPGTGFGESTYSPIVSVAFEPDVTPLERVFLKYEWRETLCRKGILPECMQHSTPPSNRMWQDDNNSYAPPPPSRY